MSSWNTLPANYEDFQAELNHVKDGIEILQRLVTEYIQLEVKKTYLNLNFTLNFSGTISKAVSIDAFEP